MNPIEYITSYTSCFFLCEGDNFTIPLQVLTFGGKRISRDLKISLDNNVLKVIGLTKVETGCTELTVRGMNPGISRLRIETVEQTSNPLWLLFHVTKIIEVIWIDGDKTKEQFDSDLSWKAFFEQHKNKFSGWKLIQ